jgi:hypothetical protein
LGEQLFSSAFDFLFRAEVGLKRLFLFRCHAANVELNF